MNMTALEFSARLADLLRKEQHAMADFLLALAEFDRLRLWVDLGHKDLFHYLHRDLGLSRSAAHHRKVAVLLIQRFPKVAGAFRAGQLCLTTSFELARVLTRENVDEVLPRFYGLSRKEAMQVSAALAPAEVVPERTIVRPLLDVCARTATRAPDVGLPAATVPLGTGCLPVGSETPDSNCLPVGNSRPVQAPVRAAGLPARADVRPLTAERSRMSVTVNAGFHERLQEARDAVSHAHPTASDGDLLELALEALVERTARRKGIGTRRPKTPRPSRREHIPAHVFAAALERAGGCCEWKLASGGVCGSRRKLQGDHILPLALGGTSDLDNVRLLCAFHNLLAAREVFGDEWMDLFTRNPRAAIGRRAGMESPASPPPRALALG